MEENFEVDYELGVSTERFNELAQKVDEIHAFAKQLAETLNAISKNPMALMGMLPR